MSASPFAIKEVASKESIQTASMDFDVTVTEYMNSMPIDQFLAPQGEHWSPADHLRHISHTTNSVAKAMGINKFLLLLRFGGTFRGSRTYQEITDIYREALRKGAQAGRFTPSKGEMTVAPAQWRIQVLERWQKANNSLTRQCDMWNEWALDHLRFPHPLIGNLTAREMLFFTLMHNAHHADRTWERSLTKT